jgi:hypothetical protein
MTDRKKELLFQGALLALLIILFSKILFTGKIIRAPDIINEFYWGVKGFNNLHWTDVFGINLSSAGWNPFINSGFTNEGGMASLCFLFLQRIVFWLVPAPESVAWYMVLHLFVGAAGTYCYCRLIGASRPASLLGGVIFAVAPENASLINAGHVMKIATISFAPWAFYFLEKGFRTRRLIFFLTTGFVLAYQFFHTHWQIAFYTCLGVALYGVLRTCLIVRDDRNKGGREMFRLLGLNLTVLLFFLSTVAISLAPLANWSRDTNRGAQSGANQGKGGLARDEAMSWSMPPEEIVTFVVPGFFGFSRQEAGENPENISSYYWGRMVFTQTTDYMGLLPWLLLPLPLIFRRDRYTWLAMIAVGGGIIFSMGKYTFIYNFLFDYFPGIDRFRVPKMMMFMTVLGLGVLAARGLDLLLDGEVRESGPFRKYIIAVLSLPLILLLLLGVETAGKGLWISMSADILSLPTRYEQGAQLVMQRWNNIVAETSIALFVCALYSLCFFAFSRKWISVKVIPLLLLLLFMADCGRVNNKFMFLVDEPPKAKGGNSPVMEFLLAHNSKLSRVLPMDGSDPMQYATSGIPVMFTANAVQQQRWLDFLNAFSYNSPMPDMVNVKYLVLAKDQYAQAKGELGDKYQPVFQAKDGSGMVLENRALLPKGWLVPAVAQNDDPGKRLSMLQNPGFDPRRTAIVESPPPIAMARPDTVDPLPPNNVTVTTYEGERIVVDAKSTRNGLLVLGEKYYRGWKATVDGRAVEIYPVNHVLRGVYLTPGSHRVEFVFDPLPFKIGKWLTLTSFLFYALFLGRDICLKRNELTTKHTETTKQ